MKQKLIELLKAVPEIKEDLEELKIWCVVELDLWSWEDTEYTITDLWEIDFEDFRIKNLDNYWHIDNIIWNPIEEYHLRMYLCNKLTDLDQYIFTIYWELQEINTDSWEYIRTIFKLENKSFDNQSEEVYEEIFNFLTK